MILKLLKLPLLIKKNGVLIYSGEEDNKSFTNKESASAYTLYKEAIDIYKGNENYIIGAFEIYKMKSTTKEDEDEQEVLLVNKAEILEMPKVNLVINKTDSLTGSKLADVRFKIELTNVESMENYQIAQTAPEETQNPPTVVYVKTDSNGQINLTGIMPTDKTQPIIATITEIGELTATGYHYKKIDSITTKIKYSNNAWSIEEGPGLISANTVTVEIQNTPYIGLSGNVWEDGQTGEKNVLGANGLKDNGESGIQGVIVELYSVKDSNVIRSTVTDANGNYSFTDIPKTNEGYKIIFRYNGINYIETSMGTVSKPTEVNREIFNNRFKTISTGQSNDGTALTYTYNNEKSILNSTIAGHTIGTTDAKFQIAAQTETYTNTVADINCGLVKKNFDLALGTDVKSATLKINGKTTEYTYAQIMNGVLDFQNSSSTTQDVIYNLYLYASDYNYRIDDYKTDIKGESNEDNYEDVKNLEAYVTYSIILKAQTTQEATVEQFVYYYDGLVYSPVFSINDVIDGYKVLSIEGNKITFESDSSNNALTEENSYRKEVNLTFRVNKNGDNIIIRDNVTNIAEIIKYSTTEGGLIDKDSAPGNGIIDGKITQYEDDTDESKGLNIVLRNEETRAITGTVFEDADKDGILNNENIAVNDVIVQLIEIKKIGGVYYEYIWQETKSGSNQVRTTARNGYEGTTYTNSVTEAGKYEFKDFIPGNYIIRFIYGDGRTYDVTDNVKTYNGQDYKSAIDTNYNKQWYNTSTYDVGASVARDNEARRLEVMAYSSTINGEVGKALAEKTSLNNTWMSAETSKINIPVDDVENAKIETANDNTYSTTASYEYTTNNTKVLFGDMNFGLELRPETNIVLEKHITALKITPRGTGVQSIIDAKADIEKILNDNKVELTGIKNGLASIISTRDNRGFWQVATDVEELLQGAQLEVEYTYVLRNDGEKDYLSAFLVNEYEKGITDGTYLNLLTTKSAEVKDATKGNTHLYGNYLGTFYYTGKLSDNDKIVPSRIDVFQEALNNDFAFNEETEAYFSKVNNAIVDKTIYNTAGELKIEKIYTVIRNNQVSTFLIPGEKDYSKTVTLKTTLSSVRGGELGANLPSYIAEIVQYSNAAGRKDMNAIPANLGYVHSKDTTITMANNNEQDEFWAETIIITKPTGEDKLSPLQIVLITISAVAVLGAGIVLIKKYVLKK